MHKRKSLRKTMGMPSSKRVKLQQAHYDMRIVQDFQPKPCSVPCPHEPGSPERIATLSRRIDAGESLWHPADKKFFTPGDYE